MRVLNGEAAWQQGVVMVTEARLREVTPWTLNTKQRKQIGSR